VLVTFSTFPIVNNRQMTKAKSIMELVIVAMIMLCGALVRTFFTSSPVHALASLQHIAHKGSVDSYEALHQSLNFVNYLEI
jgi:hypothetical protein